MSKTPQRVLGDGAIGDVEKPDGKSATQQPGLVDSPEKAGKTPEEQAAADLRALEKEQKSNG